MSEENKDQVRSSSYDGIQEYDNQLPRWWIFTFLITVIVAFIYWSRFYIFESAPSQKNELIGAIEQVEKMKPKEQIDSSGKDLHALYKDPETIKHGVEIFKTNCIACHGQNGEGTIGPNLTDKYWIHGSNPEQIEHTVTTGVIEKGMASWKGILSPTQIHQVVAYVMSLEGTNPPNPKAPQGDLKK